jgi:hypothetical protein
VSTKDEVTEALEAANAADMRVRARTRAVVYGYERADSVLLQTLVLERNAAFANFLQAFMRRSRSMAVRVNEGASDGPT